jgi:CRP-like cAMP-binding protein
LHYLHYQQQIAKAEAKLAEAVDQEAETRQILTQNLEKAKIELAQHLNGSNLQTVNPHLARYYHNFAQESFQWLLNPVAHLDELVLDVVDTIRALRCADALRQRGHAFRTSAGYEVLVNQHTANGVYALRTSDGSKLFLLEGKDAISSGEANITGCELDQDRNLRVSFDRGSFSTPEAVQWAVYSAALVINDIQADVIESFIRCGDPGEAQWIKKRAEEMQILVEGVDDNPDFARAVCRELGRMNPAIAHRCLPVASLQKADLAEVERYLSGSVPVWSLDDKKSILAEIAKSGQKVDHLDMDQAFQEVRIIQIRSGEVLMENGSPASFVYLPMGQGLQMLSIGGYAAVSVQPWMQIGDTAAIKGSVRNARVVAERDTDLLMIPKQIYLQYWYNPYTPDEFVQLFDRGDGSTLRRRYLLTPIAVQKKQMNKNRRQRYLPLALQLKTLFQDAEQVKPFMTYLEKQDLFKGRFLFQQGDPVEALYFVERGQIKLSFTLYGGQVKPVQTCDSGELVGEVDFYTQSVYQTTATAVQNTQLYLLTRAALQQMQKEHPEAAIAFSQMVLTRIANRLAEFASAPDYAAPVEHTEINQIRLFS